MYRTCFACIVLLFYFNCQSQPYYSDSVLVSRSPDHLRNLYKTTRNSYAPLFSGPIHYSYSFSIEGSPYWEKEWHRGNVVFEHVLYENILMKYDLVKDVLVVMSAEQGSTALEIFSPRIQEFSFAGSKFIFISKDNPFSLKEGFYQELAGGKMIALCKTQRQIQETISGNQVERKFSEIKKYYIISEGRTHIVNRKNDLSDAIKNHKKEVIAFLKEKNLKFRKNKEQIITDAVAFYNKQEGKTNE